MYFTLHVDSSIERYGLAAVSNLGIVVRNRPIPKVLEDSGSTVKELFAIVDGLRYLLRYYKKLGVEIERVAIRSDSLSAIKFTKDAVKGVFSKKEVIKKLQEEFKVESKGLVVGCKWVKGHVRNTKGNGAAKLNVLVDKVAARRAH